MCSSCGQRAAAMRAPGVSPRNPIRFGATDKRPAQPATFLKDHGTAKAGQYLYVAGGEVEQAAEDGLIKLGYQANPTQIPAKSPRRSQAKVKQPEHYVAAGPGKWVGFRNQRAAERYAKSVGSEVVTRAELLSKQETT